MAKKRSDGRYIVTVTINGKRKFFYGKTKSAVIAARDAFLEKNRNAVHYDDTVTLKAWYSAWCAAKRPTIAESTYHSYTSYIERYILPELGDFKLTDFTPPGLRNFIQSLIDKGLSSRTVSYTHTLLKSMFAMAVDDEIIAKNPMIKIKPPKKQKTREMVTLSAMQVKQFVNSISNKEHKAFFQLAFASGLRRSELLGLRWSDVNFKQSTISVVQTVLSIVGKTVISPTTKNKTSRRTIGLDSHTMAVLRHHQAVIGARRLKCLHWQNNDLVFPGKFGNPRDPDWASKLAKRYANAIGVEGFTMHGTRHTHATLLIESGINMKVLQDRLGHSSFKETMDTYSHVTPSMKTITNELLEKVF